MDNSIGKELDCVTAISPRMMKKGTKLFLRLILLFNMGVYNNTHAAISFVISSFHVCQHQSGLLNSHDASSINKVGVKIESESGPNDCFEFNIDNSHRRNFLKTLKMLSLATVATLSTPFKTQARELKDDDWRQESFHVNDDILSSLVYERILGKGSYKTVYMVSVKDDYDDDENTTNPKDKSSVYYALALEELRVRRDVNDAFSGIEISKKLQRVMEETHENVNQFERVDDWWVQSKGLADFETGQAVFPHIETTLKDRTQKEPGKFLGSKWLIALKPLYDMDLKRFAQKTPLVYSVNDANASIPKRTSTSTHNDPDTVAGISLGSGSALKLALELCHEGKLMHSAGIVHRDIKPKNIMIWKGRPVIIDFGFSKLVEKANSYDRICIAQQGVVKGEAGYVLAEDVEMSRGCQEGDRYAMGKTLYELFFGQCQSFESAGKVGITVPKVKLQNSEFRATLASDYAGSESRFLMSQDERDIIMRVITGLCSERVSLTFSDAESLIVSSSLTKQQGLVDL